MKGIARGARTRHLNTATPRTRELLEYSQAKPDRVDKEAGIIYGVKLVGQKSRNTHGVRGVDETRYTDGALQEAAALYEGLPVNYDHAPKNQRGEARSTADRGGKLFGVTFKPGDGLYGNVRLLKEHPRAATLMESAASPEMSDLFACSHHAYGRSSVQGRTLVVDKIPDPRSVDIVTAGGTVRSLFESQGQPAMKTVREILESLVAKFKGARKPRLTKLLEADVLPESDAEMEAPAEEAEPEEQMEDALEAAICAVVRKLFDGETDVKGALSKIKEIFKAHASITGEEGDDEEESDDDADSEETETETKESLREKAQKDPAVRKLLESDARKTAELETIKRKAKNIKLLEAAKLPKTALTAGFLELIEDADSDKEIKRLIENQREAIGVSRPKSAGSHHGANMGGGSVTGKDAVAAFSAQVRGF